MKSSMLKKEKSNGKHNSHYKICERCADHLKEWFGLSEDHSGGLFSLVVRSEDKVVGRFYDIVGWIDESAIKQ